MRRAAFPLSLVALAGLVFAGWMHPAVLWPTNVGWLLAGDDRGQSALGLFAWLRAGGLGLRQPLLDAPEGMTLLFTDSIPLLGLLLAPVAGWLPMGVQFIGGWYLLCLLLQALFAGLLLRRWTSEPFAVWAGVALLVAFPALLNRYGHASLCAQWLLLWALWVFVEPRRADRPWWWAAVLGVAALVHSYLLLMVAAFWGSALLSKLWRGQGRVRALVEASLALIPAATALWLNGVFAGPYQSTGSYGRFPAALDAWWNPANPAYSALLWSSPAGPNGQGFEGFNYLGAGLIALVLLAVVQLATGRLNGEHRALLRRLAWLLPAFAVLAIVAIGPAPEWRGQPLFVLDLPRGIVDALDPVRAAGRLLWPATYTLAFAAIVCASGGKRATLVLGAALAAQLIDLAPMLAAIRPASAQANDPRRYTRTSDPRWATLVASASAVQFEPARAFGDLALMEEIGWRAITASRPLRYFYASREALATRRRIAADSLAFARGEIDPTRLYILVEGKIPAAVADRVRRLDGVSLIPPSRIAAKSKLCPSTGF